MKNKILSERYGFSYEREWITIDIPQELVKELDLPLGEDIPYPVYISPAAINRKATFGGITIKNEKEIFIQKPFNKSQASQTELSNEEIASLTSEKNKVRLLINKAQALRAEKSQLLTKINQLEQEDKVSQQTIINLQNEVADLETQLTEIERIKNDWQDKCNNLTTERDNLQTQNNDLNQQLITANTLITNKDNEITRLEEQIRKLKAERDARPGDITLDQWNNDYSRRPTQQQLNSIQQELNKEKGWWDKWINSGYESNDNIYDPTKFKIYSGEKIREIYKKVCGNYPIDHYHSNFEHRFSINVLYGTPDTRFQLQEVIYDKPNNAHREGRRFIKMIYEYYKNQ